MQLTPEQQSILSATAPGCSFLVSSCAGSGKTSTIIAMANHWAATTKHPLLIVAFNKSAADHLKSAIPHPNIKCSTLNALGYAFTLNLFPRSTRLTVMQDKYAQILGTKRQLSSGNFREAILLCTLLRQNQFIPHHALAKQSPTSWSIETIQQMLESADHIPAENLQRNIEIAISCLTEGITQAFSTGTIDFLDQLYLPYFAAATPRTFYPTAIVDEYQDLSPLDIYLLQRSASNHILVGDPMQRIYAFRGAAVAQESCFPKITDKKSLSISWRCSEAAIEEARNFCDAIHPAPTARRGSVRQHFDARSRIAYLSDSFATGESCVALSYYNAPLLALAAQLRNNCIPYYLNNPMLCQELLDLWSIAVPETPALSPEDRSASIIQHFNRKREALRSRILRNMLLDKQQMLLQFIEEPDPLAAINSLFKRPTGNAILLSTIHKYKGREAHHVLILDPLEDLSPELAYVAVTRSQDSLCLFDENSA